MNENILLDVITELKNIEWKSRVDKQKVKGIIKKLEQLMKQEEELE